MEERFDAGRKVIREMFGDKFLAAFQEQVESGGFGSTAGRLALGSAFADVWGRPGLERKYRSMVVMGALIALRTPHEFKNHVRAALNNGCTVAEVEEVIIQTIPYVGFPAAAIALGAAGEVLQELGLLKPGQSAEDRGLR
ncbi:MAG: carboxymuconolactone decarboxylase family protein [Steroidobacteraceae bacterium]